MKGAKHQHRPDTDQRGARRDALADGQALEDYFAAKGTSAPVVLDQADKEALLVGVGAWVDEVGHGETRPLLGLPLEPS